MFHHIFLLLWNVKTQIQREAQCSGFKLLDIPKQHLWRDALWEDSVLHSDFMPAMRRQWSINIKNEQRMGCIIGRPIIGRNNLQIQLLSKMWIWKSLFFRFILYYIKKYPDVEMHFQTDRKWKRKYTLPPIFPRFPKFKKKRKIECSHNFSKHSKIKRVCQGQVKWLCFCGKVIPMTSVSLWRCHSLVCSSSTS